MKGSAEAEGTTLRGEDVRKRGKYKDCSKRSEGEEEHTFLDEFIVAGRLDRVRSFISLLLPLVRREGPGGTSLGSWQGVGGKSFLPRIVSFRFFPHVVSLLRQRKAWHIASYSILKD